MSRVWIFDLDDTLHDASSHIFPMMNRAMTHYIMDTLQLEEAAAFKLRQHYWRVYGATLKGLMRHHGGHPTYFSPYHFLQQTHALGDLESMVIQTRGLRSLIKRLPGRKVVFTNAPMSYALRVLKLLGIGDMFETVFSVESTRFHPKPSMRGFKQLLTTIKAKAADCVMLEDNLPALMTAKRMGMKTVYVSKHPRKPSYVNRRISSIMKLNRTNF